MSSERAFDGRGVEHEEGLGVIREYNRRTVADKQIIHHAKRLENSKDLTLVS